MKRYRAAPRSSHSRTALVAGSGAAVFCSPPMPSCGADDVITAYDVEVRDLPATDVQDALAQATPPLYGVDTRPSDGTVFEFKRADGRGFLVGEPCVDADPSCVAISPGIARVRRRLQDLDTQQLLASECAALSAP